MSDDVLADFLAPDEEPFNEAHLADFKARQDAKAQESARAGLAARSGHVPQSSAKLQKEAPAPGTTVELQRIADEVKAEAEKRLALAKTFAITNDEEWNAYSRRMVEAARWVLTAKAKFAPAIAAQKAAARALEALLAEAIGPVEEEQKLLKQAWLAYDEAKRERLAREEAERRRVASEARQRQAEAEPIDVDLPFGDGAPVAEFPLAAPTETLDRPKGVHTRAETVVTIEDVALVMKAILAGHPQTAKAWLVLDEVAIRKAAKGLGAAFNVPGVKVEVRQVPVVSTR
jgi:hypothetical protein